MKVPLVAIAGWVSGMWVRGQGFDLLVTVPMVPKFAGSPLRRTMVTGCERNGFSA